MSNTPPVQPAVKPNNILVAEDSDTDFLLTRRKLIKIFSPEIIERACNRHELCASLLTPRDLIVADLHLGDIEEMELIDVVLRAQPKTPVLVLTGTTQYASIIAGTANIIAVINKGDLKKIEQFLEGWAHRD